MSLNEEEIQQARYDLIELQIEHSDLDHAIQLMLQNPYTDQLRLRRMKKRKLKLKDNIQRLTRHRRRSRRTRCPQSARLFRRRACSAVE